MSEKRVENWQSEAPVGTILLLALAMVRLDRLRSEVPKTSQLNYFDNLFLLLSIFQFCESLMVTVAIQDVRFYRVSFCFSSSSLTVVVADFRNGMRILILLFAWLIFARVSVCPCYWLLVGWCAYMVAVKRIDL